MASLTRSLNFQTHFDIDAKQILDDHDTTAATTTARATTIQTTKISNFFQEFGANFINSIQLQNFQKTLHTNSTNSNLTPTSFEATLDILNQTTAANEMNNKMDIEFIPNQIIIDSSTFESMDELQKQLEYDRFMNEVWIGIVFTLILISMIFCMCSCFLYHQFRTWKRNYHSTIVQANAQDIESLKNENMDDPVPEYTLVSGLPSYEAALELIKKSPNSSFIVYPNVFHIFNENEKCKTNLSETTNELITTATTISNQQNFVDSTTPLLTPQNVTTPATVNLLKVKSAPKIPSYDHIMQKNFDLNETLLKSENLSEKELLEIMSSNDCSKLEDDEETLKELIVVKSKQ